VKLLPIAAEMREAVAVPIACQPVAYQTPPGRPDFTSLPEFPFALDPLQLPRAAMAEFAVKARELGIGYIGSCCGSVAVHVRAMARALGTLPPDDRDAGTTPVRGVHGAGEPA
jgi:methionine synthase I (cobalamin-dependent)